MPRKSKVQHEPIYIHEQQAGWNDKSQRWTSKNGRITSQARVTEENQDSDFSGRGGIVPIFYRTPITDAFGKFEVVSSGLQDSSQTPYTGLANVLQAALQLSGDPEKKRPANYMLPQVQTRLRLAEHFYQTDGDATNVCDVPIEIISRDLVVECQDTTLRNDIEDFIAENTLEDTAGELWRTMRVYGQSFPFEAWDASGKNLKMIVNLYPVHVHVGYNWGFWLGPEVVGERAWTDELIESRLPPALHRPLMRHWNENPSPLGGTPDLASGIPLDGDILHPIRDRDFNWTRYSMPMLSRGFRDLTSRIVHEDAIRAVTEGYRYQLWVFMLGDADHPPLTAEIKALQSALAGVSGERTGMLVWRNSPLSVEILVPAGLDKLMGNEYLGYLTKSFFRKMGITSQVVSGESPGQLATLGGRGGTTDLEVQIYIERCRYQANQVTGWVEYIVKKWVRANSKAVKPLAKMKIKFAPTTLEMQTLIKDVMLPMYESGALDLHNLQGAVGLNYEAVTANKKDEQKDVDSGLYRPPATFAQMTLGPDGAPQKEIAQTKPAGAPDKIGELRNRMSPPVKRPKAQKVVAEDVRE